MTFEVAVKTVRMVHEAANRGLALVVRRIERPELDEDIGKLFLGLRKRLDLRLAKG
jgi:hypothetical protein